MDEVMETVIKDMLEKATAKGIESGAKAERELIRKSVEIIQRAHDKPENYSDWHDGAYSALKEVLALLEYTPGEDG